MSEPPNARLMAETIVARHPHIKDLVHNAKRIGLGLPIQPSNRFPGHETDYVTVIAIGWLLDGVDAQAQAEAVAAHREANRAFFDAKREAAESNKNWQLTGRMERSIDTDKAARTQALLASIGDIKL